MTVRLQGMLRLPARICADATRRIRVFLDGDRLTGVVAFDTWQGWVDIKRRDDRGRVVLLAGEVQIERRHGRVQVVAERATVREIDQLGAAGLVIA